MVNWPEIKKNKFWHEYHRLMDKARERRRPKSEHVERHHVLPVALGGKGTEMVLLTYGEHFHAHELLVKFCTGLSKYKMYAALSRMTHRGIGRTKVKITKRQHIIAKRANSIAVAARVKSQWLDPNYRDKMVQAQIAPWKDPQRRIKMLAIRRAIWDPESLTGIRLRALVSVRFKGKKKSPGMRKKISAHMKAWHSDPRNKAKHRAGLARAKRASNGTFLPRD